MTDDIDRYHAPLSPGDQAICDALRAVIARVLPKAEAEVWHAHPVWFRNGNPIVGYSKLKSCVRLLFWSGQPFASPGLTPEESFKAAEARYRFAAEIEAPALDRWLAKARVVQWDWRNLMRNEGRLDRLS